jgi:hypothetical protein
LRFVEVLMTVPDIWLVIALLKSAVLLRSWMVLNDLMLVTMIISSSCAGWFGA